MNLTVICNQIEQPKARLLISLGIAALFFICCISKGLEFQLLSAWTSGLICFLLLIWSMMIKANVAQTRRLAQQQEIDHRLIFLMAISIAFTSLFVIGFILARYKNIFCVEVGLSILAVFFSWLLIHTLFAHYYASFYYRPTHKELAPDLEEEYNGGLQFPGSTLPRYSDFLYFAVVIGMTAQTSDVSIVKSAMRRLSLGQMIISYYFYSVVLALTVSIIAGLI